MSDEKNAFAGVCLLVVTTVASATDLGVGARIGTTGIGADAGIELVPSLVARLGDSYLNYNRTFEDTEVSYDGKLKLSNPSLLLDWLPWSTPFRLTAGLLFANNGVSVTGQPTGGTYTLNGVVYPASAIGSLTGELKAGHGVKPYLGIGYGNVAGKGVNFYIDLGVAFTGTPSASLNVTCGPALAADQYAQLRNDIAAEAADLQNSVKNYKYYPVANIGVTFGF